MAKTNTTQIKVNSLDELKKMLSDGRTKEFFILLNFGIRSSKSISYNKATDTFYILNEIDNSDQTLNSKQIMNKDYTMIGEAIKLGVFYAYS